ncbi:MAG: DNA-protecting protein DprA [Prevotellaceae bacterium]|jgi:DNA processing protein|nr:DNA-protecting protein DprA [Prevotellaceae bacterium]
MKYTENAINILAAKTYKRIGGAWIVKNIKGNESIEKIISLLNKNSRQDEQITVDNFEDKKKQIKKRINAFEDCCDGIVALGDKHFPKYRGKVKASEQPVFLFYKGNIDLLIESNLNVAVIGLLNPDEKIEKSEKMVTAEILKHGATIVSGLALGCDSIAHKTALEKGGKTIAILPSPLNNILPVKNKDLALEIVEAGGLLVTEYYEDFKTKMELSSRYKERDRLQALFCDSVVLAASYAQDSASRWGIYNQKLDCGARLAMGNAKEYGIKRAVIYNEAKHAKNPMYDLNRQFLKEDNTVIRIDSDNMTESIKKLLSKKPIINNGQTFQSSFF